MNFAVVGNTNITAADVKVEGGTASNNATTILTAIIAGAVGYFSHGAL